MTCTRCGSCGCRCHRATRRDQQAGAVRLCDQVAAVTACSHCKGAHDRAVASHARTDNGECNPYLPPRPWTPTGWDGEDGG